VIRRESGGPHRGAQLRRFYGRSPAHAGSRCHEEQRMGHFYCRRSRTRRMNAPRVVYLPSGGLVQFLNGTTIKHSQRSLKPQRGRSEIARGGGDVRVAEATYVVQLRARLERHMPPVKETAPKSWRGVALDKLFVFLVQTNRSTNRNVRRCDLASPNVFNVRRLESSRRHRHSNTDR
jgi:hypothetical protein